MMFAHQKLAVSFKNVMLLNADCHCFKRWHSKLTFSFVLICFGNLCFLLFFVMLHFNFVTHFKR